MGRRYRRIYRVQSTLCALSGRVARLRRRLIVAPQARASFLAGRHFNFEFPIARRADEIFTFISNLIYFLKKFLCFFFFVLLRLLNYSALRFQFCASLALSAYANRAHFFFKF